MILPPARGALTSKLVDMLSLKDSLPDDPLVTFVGDCTSAYYQTPELEPLFCAPPPEWVSARLSAGLDGNVLWKLVKQLPGRRAAGARWLAFAVAKLSECGLERNDAVPSSSRMPGARVCAELHMDDLHGCGRQSEVDKLLPMIRARLRLKGSGAIETGRYDHLKRGRVRTSAGVGSKPHPKHIENIVHILGLEAANSAATPEAEPAALGDAASEQPRSAERAALFRRCVGHALYLAVDRYDVQRATALLAQQMVSPTEASMRALTRMARYLKARRRMVTDYTLDAREAFTVTGHADLDWPTDGVTRKSHSGVSPLLADTRSRSGVGDKS